MSRFLRLLLLVDGWREIWPARHSAPFTPVPLCPGMSVAGHPVAWAIAVHNRQDR